MKNLKQFLCYCDYFATGEGRSLWMSIESSENKAKAKSKFVERFKIDSYFHRGIEIFEATVKNKEKIELRLAEIFHSGMLNHLMKDSYGGYLWNGCGNFAFQSYVNFS